MNNIQRLLIRFFPIVALLLLGSPSVLSAQEEATEEIRLIESMIVSDKRPPQFFFQSTDQTFQPFRIGFQRPAGANRVPQSNKLMLYRKNSGGENSDGTAGPEEFVPSIEMTLPTGSNRLLLVFYLDEEGQTRYRFLNAGPETFGALEVQMVNLSRQLPVVVMLGEERFDLEPGDVAGAIAKVRQDERFSFKYGSLQPSGGVYTSPTSLLRIPFENMRLHIFFAPVQRTIQTANGPKIEMVLRDARVFERIPANGN